jgi:hypothetical protein
MKGKWLTITALAVLAAGMLAEGSCGRSQQLVGIQIQPNSETIGATNIPVIADAGYHVQLTALGSYIHPPVTKDITDQVTWASSDQQMFSINSTGVLTATGNACGATLISAALTTNTSQGGISSSGAVVTGYMTANVTCFTNSGGGSGDPALTLTFLGNGSGTVLSSPPGFSCTNPGPCVSQAFVAGTTLTLTANPNSGSTFGGWSQCPGTISTNVCSFTLGTSVTVNVTFN